MLLDQDLTLNLVNKAFDYLGKADLTRHELIDQQYKREDRFDNVELVAGLEFISQNSDEKINKVDFISWITKKDRWEWLLLEEYHHLKTSDKIPPENLEWINNWCIRNLDKIILEGAITEKENGGYEYLKLTDYFIQFAMLLDLNLPEDYFLEMLGLIGFGDFNQNINYKTKEYRLYDYIKRHLHVSQVKDRVLRNLKDGKVVSFVLDSYVKVVEKENWIDALQYFPSYITNDRLPKYVRSHMLHLYQKNKGDSNALLPVLSSLTFAGEESYFDWDVIDYMVSCNNYEVKEFLKMQIGVSNVNQLKIGSYLVKSGLLEGFDLISKNSELLKFDNNIRQLIEIIEHLKIPNVDSKDLFSWLIDLLNVCIKANVGYEGFNRLIPVIFNKFFDIISEIKIDDQFALKALEDLLNNSTKNNAYKEARYDFYELQEKLNIHNDKSCQISQSIKELKQLGITYDF